MLDKTATIEKFLDAAAAKQPTPGGGSVAALAGALAAAMGEMVVNYSIGKKGLEEHGVKLKYGLAKFHRAKEMMEEWIREDQAAYEAVTAAKKLATNDPKRESEIADKSKLCIEIPQLMAATAVEIIDVADALVEIVNPYLLSDLAVCAELAMATTRAGIYNVRVNLPGVSDSEKRRGYEDFCDRLLSRGVETIKQVIPRIWERVPKG